MNRRTFLTGLAASVAAAPALPALSHGEYAGEGLIGVERIQLLGPYPTRYWFEWVEDGQSYIVEWDGPAQHVTHFARWAKSALAHSASADCSEHHQHDNQHGREQAA